MQDFGFYRYLCERMKGSFPGESAHEKMLPEPIDSSYSYPRKSNGSAHPSSVLIPLYPDHEGDMHVLLTLRTGHIRHAGQISFPGGRSEVNEELIDTALRETHEEIGINPQSIRVACSITSIYLYRSNSQITPFVGFLHQKPDLTINPNEVEEAFSVPLSQLLDDRNLVREVWELNKRKVDVPYWDIHPTTPLWGATAMIMSELLVLYREYLNQISQS
ncbi:NUDIX hydrolase [Rhodohalobacter mucosus]|uniref:CoA pyrophosphatase n=1 Tax=Rhodohalobacter mucosus TaxID=2079485 RepID=A0A316TLC4_9BACT|nr:CoA pyrophosphatase [Rhodohalobacter mucosus]PWN05367.1 CoA pyrophosphatase [Rhodohalobacter mucosus]